MNEEAAVQGRITTFWDTVASRYDSPGNVALPGTPQYANWVGALGSALPDSSARVLDVGTGTGFVARIAAELGHRVTAIDLSAAMLEASAMTDALEITYAVGDAVDPPFPAGSFDVVVSRSLLWTLREPETAFRNWYELLSPGGRVVAVTVCHARRSRDRRKPQAVPARSRLSSSVTTRPRRRRRCRPCICPITSLSCGPPPRAVFVTSARGRSKSSRMGDLTRLRTALRSCRLPAPDQ